LLSDKEQAAVAVAERFADGLANRNELQQASDPDTIVFKATQFSIDYRPFDARRAAVLTSEFSAIATFAHAAHEYEEHLLAANHRSAERASQALLLRDVFGRLPFRPLPPILPAVLTWSGATMVRLAQAAYEERTLPAGTLANARLAVLADALEEANCQDEAMLRHLREQGSIHIRGCWVVDLLLGKS
jgi:hypothetical protein